MTSVPTGPKGGFGPAGLPRDSNAIPGEVDADHVLGEEVVPNESVEPW